MTNQTERALITKRSMDLLASTWAFDTDEIRAKVELLLGVVEKHLIPLLKEHDRWDRDPYGYPERVRVANKVNKVLKEQIGVVTPPEAHLAVGQPCLLVWRTSFGTVGSPPRYQPILIEIARVAEVGRSGDMWVDAISLCEIPYENPQLTKVSPYEKQGIHNQTVLSQSCVVVPLHRATTR